MSFFFCLNLAINLLFFVDFSGKKIVIFFNIFAFSLTFFFCFLLSIILHKFSKLIRNQTNFKKLQSKKTSDHKEKKKKTNGKRNSTMCSLALAKLTKFKIRASPKTPILVNLVF